MTEAHSSPREEWREDYTEILPHLTQRICFIDEQGQEREFAQFPLLIGRGQGCGWVIPNKNISRHHAEVIFSLEAYSIQNLKSLNGVRVNGFKVDRVVLEDGDQVSLGELRFTFRLRKASDPRSPHSYSPPSSLPDSLANKREDFFSPSLEEEFVSPVDQQQDQQLQIDNLDLDDLYTPEAELEAEISEALERPATKKWWPALLAVLAAATVAAALVAVAYYFLQPQLMNGEKKEVKLVARQQNPLVQQQTMMQQQAMPQEVMHQTQAPASAMQALPNAQSTSGSETEWDLGPAAQAPSAVNSNAVNKASTVISSEVKIPLPQLATTSLDLPEAVRSNLSQVSKIARTAEKKTVSPAVTGLAIPAQTNKYLYGAVQQFYLSGDEVQLAAALEQVTKKIEVSKSNSLFALQKRVNHLLTLYHQADKAYQAGNKAQAFTLWAQFLGEEKAWLDQQHSAYYRKVMHSVMNEYLVRAQAAAASGNQALAAQYREKAATLEKTAPISLNQTQPTQVKPVPEKAVASVSAPAYSAADAEVLYQKGMRLEYSNLDQAITLWRQVTQTAPADSEVYAKASAKLAWYDKWRTTTQ